MLLKGVVTRLQVKKSDANVLKALSPYIYEVLDLGMPWALYCPSDLSDLVGVYSLIISQRYFGVMNYNNGHTIAGFPYCMMATIQHTLIIRTDTVYTIITLTVTVFIS